MTKQINEAVECIKNGCVVLLPTDTIYGLAVSPKNEKSIEKIYQLKSRPRNMFLPIMVSCIKDLETFGLDINENVKKLFASDFVPGPISIVLGFKEKPKLLWLKGRIEILIRIPDDEKLLKILEKTGALLVTSANKHGYQTKNNIKDILAELSGKPDMIIEGIIKKDIPSTIVNCRENSPIIERIGYVSKDLIENILNK